MRSDDQTSFSGALTSEQVRLHAQVLPLSLAGSSVMALILAASIGREIDPRWLLGWLLCLGLSLLQRAAVGLAQHRQAEIRGPNVQWLRRHRTGIGLHGLAWAFGGALMLRQGDPAQRDLVIIALVTLSAGGLFNTAFDRFAAGLFALLAASPLLLPLLMPRTQTPPTSVLVAALLLAVVTFAMLRVHRNVASRVAARLAQQQRDAAMLRSAELLDRTGALAKVGAWEIDVPSRAVRMSEQLRRLFDWPSEQRAPTWEQLLARCAPGQRGALDAALAAAIAPGRAFALDLEMRGTRGQPMSLRVVGHPHREQGQVVRIDGAMQDVTEWRATDRALADKHELLEQLLRTTGQGFWFLDTNGRTQDLNPAMCQLLGRERTAVIGRPATDFFDGADLAELRGELARRQRGERSRYEIGITRPDGSRVQCVNTASPLVDAAGQRIGSVGIWTDISARHAAEAVLRIYEVVTNSTADIVSVIDGNEIYRMVNDAWCRALGVERLAAVGHKTQQVLPKQTTPPRQQAIRDAIERGRTTVLRDWVELPRAGSRLLESTYYPFADAAVGQGWVVIVTRDITVEQQALEAARASAEQQRALLDAFPGFIAVVDGDNRYSYINARLAHILGQTPADIIGQDLHTVLGPERGHIVAATVDRVRREGRASTASHYPAGQQGAAVDIEAEHIAGPAPPTGRPPVFAFGVDVTERKQAEAALVVALQQAERANAAKTAFLSSMSHELRTPMNAVLGFGQLLQADTAQPLSPRQRGFVAEILRGGQHLLALINDLLDLGSIEAGELKTDCRVQPLGSVVHDCVALVQPLAQARQVRITCHDVTAGGLHAWADSRRLRQVLLNLLSNAIKYNRLGGSVDVMARPSGDRLEIAVRDSGPGLSAAQQQLLFRPFERLDAGRGGVEGTGIGLALSRRLVEAMDGDIVLDSQPGRGSTFTVRLRCDQPGPPPAAAEAAPATAHADDPVDRPVRDARVLYIEDNPINVMVMEAMLDGEVALSCEIDPLVGIERALAQPPDAILLDMHFPGIDGFEVLRRLRAQAVMARVPVIAVSATALPGGEAAAQAAGLAAYLMKPIDQPLLLHTLERVLRRTGQESAQRADGSGRPTLHGAPG